VLLDNAYKVHMKLMIRSVGPTDFGSYKCVSKNSLGDTDGSIKLYREYTHSNVLSMCNRNEPGTNVPLRDLCPVIPVIPVMSIAGFCFCSCKVSNLISAGKY
jgi:hypothetical protein